GGVDPNQLLIFFAGTAVTVVSMSAVSLLVSVLARTATAAIFCSYLVCFVLFLCAYILLRALKTIGAMGPTLGTTSLFEHLRDYTLIHGLIAVAFGYWGIRC